MASPERRKVVQHSILTAFLASLGFLVVGQSVFAFLKILVSDFKAAGGILLFILGIVDLLSPEKTRTFPKETLGVVTIGILLIVGPAVLTLLLMVVQTYGFFSTIFCLILNLLIVWFVFSQHRWIMKLLKEGGTKGLG